MIAEVQKFDMEVIDFLGKNYELYAKAFGIPFDKKEVWGIDCVLEAYSEQNKQIPGGLLDYWLSRCSKETLENLFLDKKANHLEHVLEKTFLWSEKRREVNIHKEIVKEKLLEYTIQLGSIESFGLLIDIAYNCRKDFQDVLTLVCSALSDAEFFTTKDYILKFYYLIEHYAEALTPEHRAELISAAKMRGDKALIKALKGHTTVESPVVDVPRL